MIKHFSDFFFKTRCCVAQAGLAWKVLCSPGYSECRDRGLCRHTVYAVCLGGEHSANWAPSQVSLCDFSGTPPVCCLNISKTLATSLTKIYLPPLRKHLIIPIRVFIGNTCLIFYQLFPYLIFSSDPIIPQMLIASTPKTTLSPNSHSETLTTM